jgi:hypothetical protein
MQKAESLDEAVKLTEVVLAGSKDLVASSKVGKARALAIAESDVEVVAKKAESTRNRIDTLSTKFHDPTYLRCADYHYIMAPHRMIRTTELPNQMGAVKRAGRDGRCGTAQAGQASYSTRFTGDRAGANTRDLMKACEINVQPVP